MLQLHGDHQHGHSHMHEEDKAELANFIWRQETVELNTVGIDIGSSTSHLLFATVRLQRRSQGLSSRFVVTHREVVWRSPIMLTPFLSDGNIDADKLAAFIRTSYESAGIARSDIDSGAVILTGEAIKRHNARAIDELFAEEAGKFVCATAGHKLECTLAAHGSGAAKLSKDRNECVLHVDIGGGTTKLSMINKGEVLGVCAFAVGGRLLAQDDEGAWTRVDDSVRLVADELGIATDPESMANESNRQKIVTRLAEVAVDFISGKSLDRLGMSLQLTEALPRPMQPTALTFSGVSRNTFSGVKPKSMATLPRCSPRSCAGCCLKRSIFQCSTPVTEFAQRSLVLPSSRFRSVEKPFSSLAIPYCRCTTFPL